jgi:glycyl-tRNA synthetase beta chain
VPTGAGHYGHRFLTTSGRAGRAIKVRSFDEYRGPPARETSSSSSAASATTRSRASWTPKAQRLHGRHQPRGALGTAGCCTTCPTWSEYPSVIAGTFSPEFLSLPEEVLTTTLIHHQHYFPIEATTGSCGNAFLAVINTEPDNERTIARNAERVVTARLRDATFFWEADRKDAVRLAGGSAGDAAVPQEARHRTKDKAERIEKLAEWIAREALGLDAATAAQAATAARLAKADLTTRHGARVHRTARAPWAAFTRARKGSPRRCGRRSTTTTCPWVLSPTRRPRKRSLGRPAATWAAVSLADKLDTIVGLFSAGEKPTGSREKNPYGFAPRRAGRREDPRRSA